MINLLHTKGFTLVETLIAIGILLIVATYPLMQLSENIRQGRHAEEQILATFLAQEAIEIARVVRDSDRIAVLKDDEGTEFTRIDLCNGTTCRVDALNASLIETCGGSTGRSCVLNIDSSNRYTHGSGTATQFTRTLTVETAGSRERKLISKVNWINQAGVPKEVSATEYIFSFQQ